MNIRNRLIALLLSCLLLASCDTTLYSNISEQEANEMVSVLMRANVMAHKVMQDDTASVMVDQADFAQAVATLQQAGLPREQFSGLGEVFRREGLLSSPTEERARFIYALSQELSNTIAGIDGVLSARVHVVVPEAASALQEPKPSSAAVFIRHRPGVSIDQLTSQIKLLVTNSVEGLVYDKVSVTLVAAENLAALGNGGEQAELVKVAGAWVHPSSARALRWTLWLLALVSVVAVVFAVWMYVSLNRSERNVRHYRKLAQASFGDDEIGLNPSR